ncbi:MAG: hypothetical protein ACKV2Q_12850 [Planctomycetaceae bacterium]
MHKLLPQVRGGEQMRFESGPQQFRSIGTVGTESDPHTSPNVRQIRLQQPSKPGELGQFLRRRRFVGRLLQGEQPGFGELRLPFRQLQQRRIHEIIRIEIGIENQI